VSLGAADGELANGCTESHEVYHMLIEREVLVAPWHPRGALDGLMIQVIGNGYGKAIADVFASYSKGYVKALDTRYTYDLSKARALMKEAGYENGFTLNEFFTQILTPKFPAYLMFLERSSNDWTFIKFLINRDAVWNPSGHGDTTSDDLLDKIQHSTGAVQAVPYGITSVRPR